jgi:hypothetical protein
MVIVGWAWGCTVILACIGLLTALLGGDHLLASRSAGVLLLSITLFSANELLR